MSQEANVESPPAYGTTNDPNAPPPTYDSLFGRVKEVQKSSTGVLDFLKKITAIIVGTLGCTVLVGLTLVIPISMIIIGGLYFHNCPAERYIPIYLIVAGVFGILKELLNLHARWQQRSKQSAESADSADSMDEELLKPSPLDSVINCFLFAWFIAGCVWIYRTYEPEYVDTSSAHYCHKTLYLFSFWLTTASFIFLAIVLGCFCCICLVSLLLSKSE